jgi:hypothetical protein
MASKLDEVRAKQNSYGSHLDDFKSEIGSSVDDKVKLTQEDFYQQLNEFKAAFTNASRGQRGRLDNVELCVLGLSENSGTGNHEPNITNTVHPTADRFSHKEDRHRLDQDTTTSGGRDDGALENLTQQVKIRINEIEEKLHGLLAKSDKRAIRFLGFQSIEAGLVVDAHMVFEHIYHAIKGIDTIANMEKLYKIKVSCIADSVAMASFDARKTPKYFSKLHGHRVLKMDASYFDTIASHSDWSDVVMGYKMKLQEALAEFQESHGKFNNQAVENGSKAHSLAHAALTKSAAWIVGFIQFIDEYYRELSKAKFGPKKSWHVTTCLAKQILDEVGTLCYGAQGSFQVGNSTQICQQIVWAVSKNNDVMGTFKRLNYKNHPSIANELVKFLAINTNFEAIEKLTNKTGYLELEIVDFKKQLRISVKSTALAANKADEANKENYLLSKRVIKLEEKVARLG